MRDNVRRIRGMYYFFMKFLSPRPQPSKIHKDRLGNTIPLNSESPFAVGMWACVFAIVSGLWLSDWLKELAQIQNDLSYRVLLTFISLINFGLLHWLNRGLNRFAWYRDFKRSPLLINGTNLILIGFALFVCWIAIMGQSR